jgi:tetratricopeptide (TPR) repeat protein
MKKIFLFFLAVLVATMYAGAQKKMINAAQNALDDTLLDKALESIQTAKNSIETKDNPKTYYVMGEILQAIGKSTSAKYSSLTDNPLVEAFNSYQKSLELDPKKYKNEIDLKLSDLTILAKIKAIDYFDTKNYEKALEHFELVFNIEKDPIFKTVDTSNIFNCGLTAMNVKKYDKAIEYFKKAIDLKFEGGGTYSWLRKAYLQKGDTAMALATMQKAFEEYPSDINVLVDQVNYYVSTGQTQKAFDFLSKAKEKDPNNSSFYSTEGTLYEKLNKQEDAIKSYEKAIELNQQNYDAYFCLGILYYNNAVIINNKATEENDNTKYNVLIEQRNKEFEKGLPYMEQAHKIDPKADEAAKNLKVFYIQLQMNDKLELLKKEMGW